MLLTGRTESVCTAVKGAAESKYCHDTHSSCSAKLNSVEGGGKKHGRCKAMHAQHHTSGAPQSPLPSPPLSHPTLARCACSLASADSRLSLAASHSL